MINNMWMSPVSREVVKTHKDQEDKTIKRLLKHGFKIVEIIEGRKERITIIATRRFSL